MARQCTDGLGSLIVGDHDRQDAKMVGMISAST
jgi:hypothetical protein